MSKLSRSVVVKLYNFASDIMDCDYVSTGIYTPMSFGFHPDEAQSILQGFLNTEKVKCMEFWEENPLLDNRGNNMAEPAFDILNDYYEKDRLRS